jgi:hypothetical protein
MKGRVPLLVCQLFLREFLSVIHCFIFDKIIPPPTRRGKPIDALPDFLLDSLGFIVGGFLVGFGTKVSFN